MHELSIAMSLVDVACEEIAKLGDEVSVDALHVRLGALSGVVKEALLFSFDLAASGTPIEGARLEIEDVTVTVFCPDCNAERELDSAQHFHCPVCGALCPEVVHGRELQLTALEVTERAGTNHRGPQGHP
jgi:hydrogenase nickel incorporation protein HypA/HybF